MCAVPFSGPHYVSGAAASVLHISSVRNHVYAPSDIPSAPGAGSGMGAAFSFLWKFSINCGIRRFFPSLGQMEHMRERNTIPPTEFIT